MAGRHHAWSAVALTARHRGWPPRAAPPGRSSEDELLHRIVILIVSRFAHLRTGRSPNQIFVAGSAATSMAEQSNPSASERERSEASDPARVPSGAEAAGSSAAKERPDASPRGRSAGGGGSESSPSGRQPGEHVRLKSIGSLERLRDRVENAAHELKRLREENQALSERVRELESRPAVDAQGTFLSLEHDPELLRRKISGFIEAIDRYLERERNRS